MSSVIHSSLPFRRPVALAAALLAGICATPAAFAADYANVISSTAVVASVPQMRQVCSDSQQIVQNRPSGAGAVIGAIAGGVLGNTVGGGFGRAAATGIGAVAGSVVGNNVEANNAGATAVPVRRCQNVTSYEQRTVGYDVVYEYAGQRYSTRMASDPGRQFAVNVQPVNSAPMAVPADPRVSTAVPPPAYVAPAPVAVAPAQSYYYDPLPQPVYYDSPYYAPSYYAAPAVIGLGIGLGLGYGWHGGYHHGGYHGGGHHWH